MENPASVRQIVFGEPNGCQIHDKSEKYLNIHSIFTLFPCVLIIGTVGTNVLCQSVYVRYIFQPYSPLFYLFCSPEEPDCTSLRCQFGCQIEREGEVGCLCPPGLHLASDNRTCKGDPSFLVLPYPNFHCVKLSLNLHYRHIF